MKVRVKAPARLHFGFITPVRVEERCFGSLGAAVDEPATVVTARPAS
ncbi:MAG: GHMP kinase, partial [Thermoprotei archaeon]